MGMCTMKAATFTEHGVKIEMASSKPFVVSLSSLNGSRKGFLFFEKLVATDFNYASVFADRQRMILPAAAC